MFRHDSSNRWFPVSAIVIGSTSISAGQQRPGKRLPREADGVERGVLSHYHRKIPGEDQMTARKREGL
jgi:hypothetical protein